MQQKLIGRIVLLIPALVFLLFVLYRILLVYYPQPDVGGVEGNVIYFIQRVLDGQQLYTNPERDHYSIAQYTPLYYYAVAGLARLGGLAADNTEQVFMVSRVFALLLNLVFAGLIYLTGRRILGMGRLKNLAAAGTTFIFLEITSFSRPDSLLHVLMFAAFYFFLASEKTDRPAIRRNHLLWAALFAALAVFAKQTAIVLPLLFAAALYWRKRGKELTLAAALYLLVMSAGLLCLYFMGEWPYFFANIVGGVSNGFRFSWFRSVIFEDFYLEFGLLLVPVFFFLLWKMKQEQQGLLQVIMVLVTGLFLLENILVLKHGSNIGYFTEWWSFVFLLLAYYWPAPGEQHGLSGMFTAVFCFVWLIKAFTLVHPLENMRHDRHFSLAFQRLEGEKQLARYIQQKDPSPAGPDVFTNFNTAESFLSNLLFRRAAGPQMDIIGLASYGNKTYDYTDLKAALQDGRIRWVIMRNSGPQLVFFDQQLSRFKPDTVMAGFALYKYQAD